MKQVFSKVNMAGKPAGKSAPVKAPLGNMKQMIKAKAQAGKPTKSPGGVMGKIKGM